jgi:predicted NUDIX family NTP pyrophosphohydrolase
MSTGRPRVSAGLLMYRRAGDRVEVLLAHPGGPYFRKKDAGHWTIPKGEIEPDEDMLATAQREFTEETGFTPQGPYIPLSPIRQKGGKIVHAWAFEGNCDVAALVSNTFTTEWPPHSGISATFPEVDRVEFFDLHTAKDKIKFGQTELIDELRAILEKTP